MQQRDRDIVEHIIRYCGRVESYLESLENSPDRFFKDLMCQDACCMCIAQIGELSGHLSDEYRKNHTELPWREIKDTRNFYVHNYGGINLEYVWNTATKDLPKLKQHCQKSLEEQQDQTETEPCS